MPPPSPLRRPRPRDLSTTPSPPSIPCAVAHQEQIAPIDPKNTPTFTQMHRLPPPPTHTHRCSYQADNTQMPLPPPGDLDSGTPCASSSQTHTDLLSPPSSPSQNPRPRSPLQGLRAWQTQHQQGPRAGVGWCVRNPGPWPLKVWGLLTAQDMGVGGCKQPSPPWAGEGFSAHFLGKAGLPWGVSGLQERSWTQSRPGKRPRPLMG